MRRTSRVTRPTLGGLALATLAVGRAFADHSSPGGRATEGSTPWLLAAAVVLVLAAVGWALFGPGARDPGAAGEARPDPGAEAPGEPGVRDSRSREA